MRNCASNKNSLSALTSIQTRQSRVARLNAAVIKMPNCSVSCCKKRSSTSNLQKDGVSFHMFPRKPEMWKLWKLFCNNKKTWHPTRRSVICSSHFRPSDFQVLVNNKRRLVENTIPSLIPNCICASHHLPTEPSCKTVRINISVAPNFLTSLISPTSLQQQQTDGLSLDDSKINSCPQRTCIRCKRSIQHITVEDQTKKLIAKVYHYFECEFEELKNQFGDLVLTPLSKFSQRTALATGVSETEILQILEEEETQNSRKRSMYSESSTSEEESSDNNLSDDEQPTPEQGTQNETEIETLVVKFDPDCDEEQVQTNTELVQVKAEPPDVDEETYKDTPAVKENPITKRKRRKTPRKEVIFQQQNTQGELSTSGASSTAQLNQVNHEQSTQCEPSTSGASSTVQLTKDQHDDLSMPRVYKRKTNRGLVSASLMLRAAREVKMSAKSIRSVAKDFGVNYRTLTRYCKKFTSEEISNTSISTPSTKIGYQRNRQIFTDEQEQELEKYLLLASSVYSGLSPKEKRSVRRG